MDRQLFCKIKTLSVDTRYLDHRGLRRILLLVGVIQISKNRIAYPWNVIRAKPVTNIMASDMPSWECKIDITLDF